MKKKSIYTLLAATAIALAACNKNDSPDTESGNGTTTVTVTAGIDNGPGTRIVYDEADDGRETRILWSKDESFWLWTNGMSSVHTFTKQGDADGVASATFKGEGLPEKPYTAKMWAVYADGPDVDLPYAVTLNFTSQNGRATGKHLLIASLRGSELAGYWANANFKFSSRVALMKLTLKNDAFKGKTLSDISLSATGLIGMG